MRHENMILAMAICNEERYLYGKASATENLTTLHYVNVSEETQLKEQTLAGFPPSFYQPGEQNVAMRSTGA